jgi:hypothetical protein
MLHTTVHYEFAVPPAKKGRAITTLPLYHTLEHLMLRVPTSSPQRWNAHVTALYFCNFYQIVTLPTTRIHFSKEYSVTVCRV